MPASRPAYVYVDDYYLKPLQRNSPRTLDYLQTAFTIVARDDEGTLYKAIGAAR